MDKQIPAGFQYNIARKNAMVMNAAISRAALSRALLDPRRDIDAECGYPKIIQIADYEYLYNREGVAERVVNIIPQESWAMDPIVHDDDLETKDSDFTEAYKDLEEAYNIYHYLERADELSGVGRFGLMLIGFDDGLPLIEPVEGFNPESGEFSASKERNINYLRVFDESLIQIASYEKDETNPRFGQPTIYNVDFADIKPGQSNIQVDKVRRPVHWTRVIHLADNRTTSEICGKPRMQVVYNRIYDLRKIVSGSGEMFWKGAFPGLSIETTPDVASDGTFDAAALKKEINAYSNGLQRYMATTGVSVNSLAPQVSDPEGHVMVNLKMIAISLGIPFRVFIGTEEAKLASDQDTKAWNKRLKRRQDKYLNPMVIRPFIDRLIATGVLPEPKDGTYSIVWPDLNAPTDKDKAEFAERMTKALKEYVTGDVDSIMGPKEYLMLVHGFSESETDAILSAVLDNIRDTEGEEPEGNEV